MRRHELEHLIRAAAAVTNEYEIVVIGSQSILGAVADPPAALLQSMEADCYPLKQPELADLIDLSVLLKVDEPVRQARLLAREGEMGAWEYQWQAAEDFYWSSPTEVVRRYV